MRNEFEYSTPGQYSSPRLREINCSPAQVSELYLAWLAGARKTWSKNLNNWYPFRERERKNKRSLFFFYEQNETIRSNIPSIGIRLFRNLIFLSTSSKYNSSINFDKIRSYLQFSIISDVRLIVRETHTYIYVYTYFSSLFRDGCLV